MSTSTAGGDLKVSLPGLCDEIETQSPDFAETTFF